MKKNKIAIGFDLGTTSVGWSIIEIGDNKNLNILDMGVRLFDDPAASDSNVQHRRECRSRRRRINRSRIRKYDFYKLLYKNKLVKDEDEFKEIIEKPIWNANEEKYYLPIELKIKGLEQKLNKNELIIILHNYIKHRGHFNINEDLDTDDKEKNTNLKKLQERYDTSKYPCENQYRWFKETGRVIGNDENAIISNDLYIQEIKKILNTQEMDEKFIKNYIDIFSRHRKYWEGPGSSTKFSQYGRWKIIDNKYEWMGDSSFLWDKTIGKCTYYPEENRNYKNSPISELFNLLNDFANMKIIMNESGEIKYLNNKQKRIILETTDYKTLTLNKIIKKLYKNKISISGLKGCEEEKPKPKIEELKSIKEILKWLNDDLKLNLNLIDNIDLIDDIFSSCVEWKDAKDRSNKLREFLSNNSLFKNITDENIEKLTTAKIWTQKTSSLSKKAQKQFIKFALSEEGNSINVAKNQMYFFDENIKRENKIFKNLKYFPNNFFKDEIISATVKRTFNQAVKVLNEILKNKKYSDYQISNIVIEMARELNSSDEKNIISKENKNNNKRLEKLVDHHQIDINLLRKGENKLKFLLWCEQNGIDIYDGKEIDLNELLKNPNNYQIDHVIPISISFNNSIANKVLTKSINNKNKSNKTPYQWMTNGQYLKYKELIEKTYDDIEKRMLCSSNDDIKKTKSKYKTKMMNYLLYEGDPINDLDGFVFRQLNDTRWVSKLLLENLNSFFSTSSFYKENKPIISVVNGALTNFARHAYFNEKNYDKRLLFKNRDIYNHHAIDASIIAFLGLNNKIQKLLRVKRSDFKNNYKLIIDDNTKEYRNQKTGDVLYDSSDLFKEITKESSDFEMQMRNFVSDKKDKFVRFSRMIISKNNMALSNETLYSLKKYNNNYYKISNLEIMKKKAEELIKWFGNNAEKKEFLLCYKYDKNLYDKLNNIYNNYTKGNKNPFVEYMNDEYIKKEIEKNKLYDDKNTLILFDEDKITRLRKLKYRDKNNIDNDKKSNLFIIKNKKAKNEKSYGFYDALNWTKILIFKNNDNKLIPYYLTINNLINKKINKETNILDIDGRKIMAFKEKNNIAINTKPLEIKIGTTFIKDNKLFFVSGGSQSNKTIEIKPLFCSNNEAIKRYNFLGKSKTQISKTINSLNNDNFKICQTDVLGNVYNIKSFDEYFDND